MNCEVLNGSPQIFEDKDSKKNLKLDEVQFLHIDGEDRTSEISSQRAGELQIAPRNEGE